MLIMSMILPAFSKADSQSHMAKLELSFHLQESGTTHVNTTLVTRGIFAHELTRWLDHQTEPGILFTSVINLQNTTSNVQKLEIISNSPTPNSVAMNAVLQYEQNIDPANFHISFNQLLRVLNQFSDSLPRSNTITGQNPSPLPLALLLKAEIHAPAQFTELVWQSESGFASDLFKFKQVGEATQDGYQIKMKLKSLPQSLNSEQISPFLTQWNNIQQSKGWGISLHPTPNHFQAHEEPSKIRWHATSPPKNPMEQIRNYLNSGQFLNAQNSALQHIKITPQDGEAWYLLATSYSLTQQTEKAQAAFKKANQLQFIPRRQP